MTTSNFIFAVILAVALAFFARSAQRLIVARHRQRRCAHRSSRPPDQKPVRIGFAQAKILRDPIGGMMHALVFWGFCVLGIGTVEIMIQGLYTPFTWD